MSTPIYITATMLTKAFRKTGFSGLRLAVVNRLPVGCCFDSTLLYGKEYSTDEMIFRCYSQRNKSYSMNYGTELRGLLTWLDMSFENGNDAPRGGRLGEFVKFSKKEFRAAVLKITGLDIDADEQLVIEFQKEQEKFSQAQKRIICHEAESISVDQDFYNAILEAKKLKGEDKTMAYFKAYRQLLDRNTIIKIESDFWQVFRLVKARAEEQFKIATSV